MAVEVGIRIEDAQVQRALEQLRLHLPASGDTKPVMLNLARVLKTGAQLRFRNQEGPEGDTWKPSRRASTEGGQTLSLTGRLKRSLTTSASSTTATVGTNDIRAAILHFGGVIRAKKGPFLSIPVTPGARQAGSPRNFPGKLSVAQSLKGQMMLVDESGKTQYLLRRQVTMPARPFLGASSDDRKELLDSMSRYLTRAWAK